LLSAFLAAQLLSLTATALLVHGPFRVLDHPNARSLHARPVPRMGGLGIFLGAGVAVLLAFEPVAADGSMVTLLLGALALITVSFADDVMGLPTLPRFGLHVIAALALVSVGLVPDSVGLDGWTWAWPAWLALPTVLIFVVWMTNLYNFMDGMDGFAGSMAVIGFGTYGLLGWLAGAESFAYVNVSLAAAALGFLVWNFPPAHIFMGDVGSIPLGYLAAGMALWADVNGIFPLWLSVLVFSPFVVDATVTLLRRAWHRERVWQAHRTHYYQRLVRSGWGHRKTLLWEMALMLGAAASAVAAYLGDAAVELALLAGWVALYAFLGMRFAGVGREDQEPVE
jgi:UDP-N-acetylmuramyl pentapeptide phosphotransferase/UDP-N-acetylglucosamine-1-phosphate transferase